MKKLTKFIHRDCPYCERVLEYARELAGEPRFDDVELEAIDECERPSLADSCDCYYVPSCFLEREKLHEGAAEREDMLRVCLRAAGL